MWSLSLWMIMFMGQSRSIHAFSTNKAPLLSTPVLSSYQHRPQLVVLFGVSNHHQRIRRTSVEDNGDSATKEEEDNGTVLCSGAVASPLLLLLSSWVSWFVGGLRKNSFLKHVGWLVTSTLFVNAIRTTFLIPEGTPPQPLIRGDRCPWPFIFFHDLKTAVRDYQTWIVALYVLMLRLTSSSPKPMLPILPPILNHWIQRLFSP